MSVVQPANPRDVQDFQFKLLGRLVVFTAQDGTYTSAVNLVAAASKYGLIFVGCPTGVQAIKSSSIFGLEYSSAGTGREIVNYPRREVPLLSQPSHLNVNSDQSYLVVAIKRDGCAHALIYSVPSFVAKNIVMVTEVRLSTKPDTSVLELAWNPGNTNILAACLSDGSMAAYELKPSAVDISTLPPATQANCFCWSPKGKQLVVGSEAGTLTQYTPDLKAVKTISPPNLGSGNVAVVNVLWLSNYQFAAAYRDKVNADERPGLLIVNAPKTGTLSFVNYEDICYSGGDLRPPQFYLIHQPAWNILMVASANSVEVGVMGLQEDQISWEQWTQDDAARAELPLSVDKEETYPVGFVLDTSTQHELPWGENQSLAPMPVLHILSHKGVLCLFHAINLRPDAARICSPPEVLPDESGLTMFTTISVNEVPPGVIPTASPQCVTVDGVVETLDQPVEFSTPLHSGSVLTSLDGGLGSMRFNLAQKFETVSTSQPSSSFGFGTTLSGASSSSFGAGLSNAPSASFCTNPTGTLSTSFGAGLTVTSPSTTPSSSFGANLTGTPSSVFGTGIRNPSTTSSFGTGMTNPPSTAFSTNHVTAPSISFGTSLATQPFISASSSVSNPPGTGFGASLDLSSTVPATKPTFSFLLSSTTTAAANLKPSPAQTASNFTFTAPAITSTPVTQQSSKPATPLVIPQLQSTTVKLQAGFLGNSSPSSAQNPAQSLITTTKVPSASVTSTQLAKVEAPTLEVKLPTESQVKQSSPPTAAAPAKPAMSPTVNNNIFYNAINEEVIHFERELAALRSRVNGITVQVGSEEEKRVLCQKSDAMDAFLRELKDTTQAQSSEIRGLKSVLMEAFAWAEETKSRAQQLNSPMYIQLARSQALDPVSARYAAKIKHLIYYVENQLRLVNEQLDSMWLEFQDSCKPNVKNKMHIPSLELVYKAMVMQNNILNRQRAIMADIACKAQEQRRSTQIPLISSAFLARVCDKEAAQLGKGETELSWLAENLVKMKLGSSDTQTSYGLGLRYRRLSRKKESLLRDMLSQSTVKRVCPTRPSRSTVGGISTGKPIVNKVDTSVATVSCKDTSKLSAGIAVTELKNPSPVANVIKSDSSHSPLFLFGSARPPGELDAVNKSFASRGFSLVGTKSGPPSKEIPSDTTVVSSSGIFIIPTTEASKGRPSVPDSTVSKSGSHVTDLASKGTALEAFSFTSTLHSGKPAAPGNFSFGTGLSKVPSVGKLNDEPKKPLETFTFSLTSSPFSSVSTPSQSVSSNGDNSQVISPKAPVTTTGVNSKTPFLTTFGPQNPQANSPPQVKIFGGGESQKPSPSFTASGSTSISSSSTNIFAQAATSMFGNLTTGSPSKQPASSGTMFGAARTSSGTTDSTPTVAIPGKESELQKSESSPKNKSPVVTSVTSENLFSQSTSLFGNLSLGSGTSSKPSSSGSIFGGGSTPFGANFIFGKQPTSTESQDSSNIQNAPEASAVAESSEAPVQKSESPSKDTQNTASKPITTSVFDQTPATTADERSKSSEQTETQVVPSTSSIFGGAKTENSTAFSLAHLASSPSSTSAPQTSVVFSQTSPAAKPLTGPIFGAVVIPPATSQQTVTPATSAATISSSSTTFSFILPTSSSSSLSSSSLFGQKTTSLFGQPVSSAAPATTSSGSFFGQSICSPTTFGQSGGSIFGQPPATTAAKTNIFGQATATTTTPSLFGQGATNTTQSTFGQTTPSKSLFGQAPSAGSSFLGGGTTGGFGSKPTFGQSGGSIFGQSGSSGFGTSGGSIFGGGGASVFGGSGSSSSSSSGNLFQPSSGGSIFGGSSSPSSGAFSSGWGSISQSGFGSPPAFQSKPGGFGGSPVFDRGASGFGVSSTFGGAPTFGGSPTFGSPGKVFGSSSPSSSVGFGSSGQQSSTFGSLASQNTMTFGNLAQNQSQGFGSPTQSVFGGSQTQQQASTPAFPTGSNAFGGSSFSSWR